MRKRKEKARRLKVDIIGAIEANPGCTNEQLASLIGESKGNMGLHTTTIAAQVMNKLLKQRAIKRVKGFNGATNWYLPSQLRDMKSDSVANMADEVFGTAPPKRVAKYSFEELIEYLNGFYAYHTEDLTKRAGKAEGEAIYWEETAKKYKAQLDQKEAKTLLSWMK